MRPLPHRLCVIVRQQASPHEGAQQPPAHALLHRGDGVGIEPGGSMEDDPARRSGREHAVDDDAVEVQLGIEGGTEALDEGHRAETGRGSGARTVRAQTCRPSLP
jgi:hypothetical protein